eukprot:11158886-Lingulodinium_polyedra.AAC.1
MFADVQIRAVVRTRALPSTSMIYEGLSGQSGGCRRWIIGSVAGLTGVSFVARVLQGPGFGDGGR